MQINIFEAKTRLSQLIKAARAAEEVVIANRGEPMVRLVPADPPPAAAIDLGNGRTILDWLEHHPLPSHARRSAAEIDAAIAEERNAWD